MHRVNDAIVRDGQVTISGLPFRDGQRVTVDVSEQGAAPAHRRSIIEVRRLLKEGVEQFDEPFEPMIPTEHWEMLK